MKASFILLSESLWNLLLAIAKFYLTIAYTILKLAEWMNMQLIRLIEKLLTYFP